jgi:hypothetical protein
MNWHYAGAGLLSALISAAGAIAAWRRGVHEATELSFSLPSMAVWALAYAIRWMDGKPDTRKKCAKRSEGNGGYQPTKQ